MLSIVLSAMFYGHSFSLMVSRDLSCPSTSDLFSPALGLVGTRRRAGLGLPSCLLHSSIRSSTAARARRKAPPSSELIHVSCLVKELDAAVAVAVVAAKHLRLAVALQR